MEVQMHELQHMLDFVASDLALFEPIAGSNAPSVSRFGGRRRNNPWAFR